MKYSNLAEMFFSKREQLGDHCAYKYKKDGQWESISFREATETAEKIAAGLRGETGFVYEVRRGAGYGVASNARDITFFIHIVPTN